MNYTMEKNFNTSGRTVRLPYMDVAKGIGILFVIIGHMGNETMECFSVAGEKIPDDFVLAFNRAKYDALGKDTLAI